MRVSRSTLLLFVVVFVLMAVPLGVNAADLKIGILPDVDSIPFIVAREEAFFAEEGIDVELVSFSNPIERDSALQARAIDGEVSDILAAAFFINRGLGVRITSITNGRYVLLAAGSAGITSPSQLRNVAIGLSTNTIIEYITDRMLVSQGLKPTEIAKVAIPKIPVRLQMLEAGTIKAACLPDPLASMAVKSGAKPVMDSANMHIAPGVMVFREDSIADKGRAIAAMYRAYARAVTALNENPDRYRNLLVTKAGFPAPVKDTFAFPHYDLPKLPDRAEVAEVIEWLLERGLIKSRLAYEELVTTEFAQ